MLLELGGGATYHTVDRKNEYLIANFDPEFWQNLLCTLANKTVLSVLKIYVCSSKQGAESFVGLKTFQLFKGTVQ
jgi:hypothetical protein